MRASADEVTLSKDGIRVAMVEDHELLRDALTSALELADAGISVVWGGINTSDAIASGADVVILDVDLGPGAPTIVERVQQVLDARMKPVIVTSLENAGDVRDSITAGALGFVPKRAPLETLIEAIRTAAQGELYLSADLAGVFASAPRRPDLTDREVLALQLWASGMTLKLMAKRMSISPHTAREYIDRVRGKYARVGRDTPTRTDLYRVAVQDGFIRE